MTASTLDNLSPSAVADACTSALGGAMLDAIILPQEAEQSDAPPETNPALDAMVDRIRSLTVGKTSASPQEKTGPQPNPLPAGEGAQDPKAYASGSPRKPVSKGETTAASAGGFVPREPRSLRSGRPERQPRRVARP